MDKLVREQTEDFKKALVPAGLQHGVITDIVSLGEQPTKFGSKEQVWIGFTFPELMHNFGDKLGTLPMKLGNRYTYSFSTASNLYKFITAIVGDVDEFDLQELLGVNAYVNIKHKDGWANIESVAPLPTSKENLRVDGMVYYDNENQEGYNDLPEWIQDIIIPF